MVGQDALVSRTAAQAGAIRALVGQDDLRPVAGLVVPLLAVCPIAFVKFIPLQLQQVRVLPVSIFQQLRLVGSVLANFHINGQFSVIIRPWVRCAEPINPRPAIMPKKVSDGSNQRRTVIDFPVVAKDGHRLVGIHYAGCSALPGYRLGWFANPNWGCKNWCLPSRWPCWTDAP